MLPMPITGAAIAEKTVKEAIKQLIFISMQDFILNISLPQNE
ncbi:hypothetical protein ACFFJN_18945 [Erwinia mallotivora]